MPSHPDDNKPSIGARIATDVVRAGYEGYAEWTGWKTYDGRDMPRWDDLPTRTRMAWVAGIGAAVRKILTPPDGGD